MATREEALKALLAAAVQATDLAASAATNEWAVAGEDPLTNQLREGARVHQALVRALAPFGYVPCDACGLPTPQAQLTARRLQDHSVVPTCANCLDMIALLHELLPE